MNLDVVSEGLGLECFADGVVGEGAEHAGVGGVRVFFEMSFFLGEL